MTLLLAVVGALAGLAGGELAVHVPAWSGNASGTARRAGWIEYALGAFLGGAAVGAHASRNLIAVDTLVVAAFALPLIATLLIDLRYHDVYPLLALAGTVTGVLLSLVSTEVTLLSSLGGLGLGAALFVLLYVLGLLLFRREAMGSGDILIAAMIGSMVGLGGTAATLFLGAILGAVAGVVLLVSRRKGAADYMPYGTGLCIAALLALALR